MQMRSFAVKLNVVKLMYKYVFQKVRLLNANDAELFNQICVGGDMTGNGVGRETHYSDSYCWCRSLNRDGRHIVSRLWEHSAIRERLRKRRHITSPGLYLCFLRRRPM